MKKAVKTHLIALGTAITLLPAQVLAQAMPWEKGLTAFSNSLTGGTARLLLTIAIAVSGLAFALGEQGGFMRKAAGVVFGGAVALGAASMKDLL